VPNHTFVVTCVSAQSARLQLAVSARKADGPGKVPALGLHQGRYRED